MGRLTVRLPDTLHQQLKRIAEDENISMNQYIVYALTRQVTLAYTVRPVPEADVREQRAGTRPCFRAWGRLPAMRSARSSRSATTLRRSER